MDSRLNFSELIAYAQHEDGEWDPGFEGDRRIVILQLGPFQHIFRRPRKFNKHFYHRVYDLNVEDWTVAWDITLLSGFCTVHSELSLRFQATIQYAKQHADRLPDINNHIKSNYLGLIKDATEKELINSEDKDLVSSGFEEIETKIETLINETLIEQDIQCRTQCRLDPSFKEINEDDVISSSGHFRHDQMVLQFIRRNYELQNQQNNERYQQQCEEERAKLEHEEKLLKQSNRDVELGKLKESQVTEKVKAKLEEEERRQRERQDSEKRLQTERLKHESRLKELELEAELIEKQQRHQRRDEIEGFVRRDIELLVLKRQQALLKKEIEKISSNVVKAVKKRKPSASADTQSNRSVHEEPNSKHQESSP